MHFRISGILLVKEISESWESLGLVGSNQRLHWHLLALGRFSRFYLHVYVI